MTQTLRRLATSWEWLLALFTLASFIEAMFWGQMSAFTPLHLPQLGVAAGERFRPLHPGLPDALLEQHRGERRGGDGTKGGKQIG